MSEVNINVSSEEVVTEVGSENIHVEVDIAEDPFEVSVEGLPSAQAEIVYVAGEGQFEKKLHEHVFNLYPHPTYDDTPDLTTLFENGLI